MKKAVSIFLALALALSLAICGIAAAEDHARDAAALTEQAKACLDAEDYETAIPMLRTAADLGDAKAQYDLGFLYDMGKGVERDYEEAVKYYRLAAEQGYAAAQCNLGFCYYNGRGVAQDYEMARKYYLLAADQGDEVALYNLGSNCFFGIGMEQDYGEACRYFCLSAEGAIRQGYLRSESVITWEPAWKRIWKPRRNGIRRRWMPDLHRGTRRKPSISRS